MGVMCLLETNDILRAVEAGLKKHYPGEPVYWNLLPKGFERPSFTLECTKDEVADVNIGLVRRSVTVRVTCYVAVSEGYGDSDRVELNARMDAVLGLFGMGFCEVGGRKVQVSAMKGVGSPEVSEIAALFTWTDSRPGYQAPEEGVPPMGHYMLNVTRKE